MKYFPLLFLFLFLLCPSSVHAFSLSSTSYMYDNIGNIQQITDSKEQKTNIYSYDDLYRLQGVSGTYSAGYVYDNDGDITTKNEDVNLTLTYTPTDTVATHAPKSVNGKLLKYDPNGNLIEDRYSNLKIMYDYENRPVEIRKLDSNQLLAKYSYDGEGKRVKKEVYDFTFASSPLKSTTLYVNQYYEKEIPVGQLLKIRKFYSGAAFRENGTLTYTTTDHLSSTTLLTTNTGAKQAEYKYYPYGTPLLPAGASAKEGPPNSWIGQKRDNESGLYFLNARYYSPSYGRFVQADSVEDPVTRGNKYSYVGESPVGRSDPKGTGCVVDNMEECRNIWRAEDPWPKFDENQYKSLMATLQTDATFDMKTRYLYETLDVGFARENLQEEAFRRVEDILKSQWNVEIVYEPLKTTSENDAYKAAGNDGANSFATIDYLPLVGGKIIYNSDLTNKETNFNIGTLGHEITHIIDLERTGPIQNDINRINKDIKVSILSEINAYYYQLRQEQRFSPLGTSNTEYAQYLIKMIYNFQQAYKNGSK